MAKDELARIAGLLLRRNCIDAEISSITDRPMAAGHLGEWIASHVFNIYLEESAVTSAIDGHFGEGPLAGKSVNVKWYLKREGLLDTLDSKILDYYLVMTGPKSANLTSRGMSAVT